MPVSSRSSGLAITNPLVLYRALIDTKQLHPDPAQHRLALHLQILYDKLKDYEPIIQYGFRLQQISRALDASPARPTPEARRVQYPERSAEGTSTLASLFQKREEKKNGLALTKALTSHDTAVQLDSPQGLMLHGEVGTDLFADCLPNRRKRRLHYSTFMLDTLSKLERLRRSRQLIIPTSLGYENDYSLLWLARDMISSSPILFLDEFQLPDRAAAKIMTNLMTCFFQLGGVLIATSNRMPEELAKAAGAEFSAPPPPPSINSFASRLGLGRRTYSKQQKSELSEFLEVLRARCEVWEMNSERDYRRSEVEGARVQPHDSSEDFIPGQGETLDGLQSMWPGNLGLGYEQSTTTVEFEQDKAPHQPRTPQYFFVKKTKSEESSSTAWQQSFDWALSLILGAGSSPSAAWTPSSMLVYGRAVPVPRQYAGIAYFTFDELCKSALGPADYITLASTYHTLILTDVPVLTLLQKNEARRLITLLDALYEARCKLLITADANPDNLFFPEQPLRHPTNASRNSHGQTSQTSSASGNNENITQDATYPETFSEIYQDTTDPFRPNISSYTDNSTTHTTTSPPPEAHQTHSCFSGIPSSEPPDQLEDTPPNTPASASPLSHGARIHERNTNASDSRPAGGSTTTKNGPDFAQSGIFTGEDERFAYKRARSRLWEMCGAKWWARGSEDAKDISAGARDSGPRPPPPSWWRPIPLATRSWETPTSGAAIQEPREVAHRWDDPNATAQSRNEGIVPEETASTSPFRTHPSPPPRFSLQHFWAMAKWGKRAGKWGKGVDGLAEDRMRDAANGAEGGDNGAGGGGDGASRRR
ncbi:MAG: hypothetical protein M1831_004131 [Alyxoria varia]|nr:MAG: hypothetical protein M1831_004131 [Alyxoria varia]